MANNQPVQKKGNIETDFMMKEPMKSVLIHRTILPIEDHLQLVTKWFAKNIDVAGTRPGLFI